MGPVQVDNAIHTRDLPRSATLRHHRDLRALYVNLKASTAGALDLTDILRAAIVTPVSAFDTFIHELARIVGSTTVALVKAAGFHVVRDPSVKFPNHARLSHPAGAESEIEVRLRLEETPAAVKN